MSLCKKILVIALMWIAYAVPGRALDSAYVYIDFDNAHREPIAPYLFGSFIEYYMCFQNGGSGIWAQEFNNRGFDLESPNYGVSGYWLRWSEPVNTDADWKTLPGGYNENALYYQHLEKYNGEGKAGVSQIIHNTPGAGFNFYVYLRGDTSVENAYLIIMDPAKTKTLFTASLGKVDSKWRKASASVPAIANETRLNVIIAYSGLGKLEIDEASIMPDNSLRGLRKEFLDIYRTWRPTSIRYPGGWFVEYSGYRWQMGIGDIDKRAVYKGYENVRLDFGVDEFIDFCRETKTNPHLVVSFLTSTPSDAADFIEYCNGSPDSKFGAFRTKNGYESPYNVKIWEIGNEIWQNPLNYANGYLEFYDKMKAKDSSIMCIMSGDIWSWKPFFDTLTTIIQKKSDVYGWHWAQPSRPEVEVTDEQIYLAAVGGSQDTEHKIDSVNKWIAEKGLEKHTKQAITEIWSEYHPDFGDWAADTTVRGGSIENGLWMASQLNSIIRNSKSVILVEKTASVAGYRIGFDSLTKKRVFYSTPSLLAAIMARNHHGNEILPVSVISGDYSCPVIAGLFSPSDVKWIDAVVTVSEDTTFISLINRKPYESVKVKFNLNSEDKVIKEYTLTSDSFLDANTVMEPDKIRIREKNILMTNNFIINPHTYTILAISKNSTGVPFDNGLEDSIIVQPIPFDDYLLIQKSGDMNFKAVKLYSLSGAEIDNLTYEQSGNFASIKTENIPKGIYFLKIEHEKGLFFKVIIK